MRAEHVEVIGPESAYGPARNAYGLDAASFHQKTIKMENSGHMIKFLLTE